MLNAGTQKEASDENASTSGPGAWVVKQDRHLQLINPAVYEQDNQKRVKALEETRKQKSQKKIDYEKTKFIKHLQRNDYRPAGVAVTNRTYEIDIQGITFHVAKNGSKLIKASGEIFNPLKDIRRIFAGSINGLRCSGDTNAARITPKFAEVGGVKFHRTKNGNLYRSAIVKAHRYAPNWTKQCIIGTLINMILANLGLSKRLTLCARRSHQRVYPFL